MSAVSAPANDVDVGLQTPLPEDAIKLAQMVSEHMARHRGVLVGADAHLGNKEKRIARR